MSQIRTPRNVSDRLERQSNEQRLKWIEQLNTRLDKMTSLSGTMMFYQRFSPSDEAVIKSLLQEAGWTIVEIKSGTDGRNEPWGEIRIETLPEFEGTFDPSNL
ncbi:hypothetical protein VPHD479_0078 [Vibrio phage D479]